MDSLLTLLPFDVAKTNVSYYTMPAVFLLAMIPHTYAALLAGRNFDVANPRQLLERCANDEKMSKVTLGRINRAKAAGTNAFETLGFFAAAVVAANQAKVPIQSVNLLSLGYVVARIVYNVVYMWLQDNRRFAPLRSLSWHAGNGCVLWLFIKAGSALNAA